MHWRAVGQASLRAVPAWPRGSVATWLSARAHWLAAASSLALYLVTLSRDITWLNYSADGGELITASMTLGTAHPPGYPVYIAVGRLFGLLPLGTVASRFALLSAVSAAAAVGLAVRCMTLARPDGGVTVPWALAVGFSLAITPLVWGQAIVAEVYPLSLLFVALFLWAVLSDRSPLIVGLAFGLALTSHLTGALLLPLALWRSGRSGAPQFALGTVGGLAPFLLLPLLANGSSPLIWGDIDTLAGWWWLVSAQLYRPNVFGLPPSMWFSRLIAWLSPAVLLPLLLWLGLASAAVWRTRRRPDRSSVAMLLTATLYVVYGFTYRPADSFVLLLPAFLLAAIVVGRSLYDRAKPQDWLLPILMLALAAAAAPARGDGSLRQEALAQLANVPSGAVVLTPGDASVSTLWYLHYVEGVRPDIIIIDENMFQFAWYRERIRLQYPELWLPVADNLDQFIQQNLMSKSICQLALDTPARQSRCLTAQEVSGD